MKTLPKKNWDEMDTSKMITEGYVKANNGVIRQITNQLNPQSALVYIILLSHKNNGVDSCYPSRSLLAEECGLSMAYIKVILRKLKEEGFIEIKSGTLGRTNRYYFPLEKFDLSSTPF